MKSQQFSTSTTKLLLILLLVSLLLSQSQKTYELEYPDAYSGTNDVMPKLYYAPQILDQTLSYLQNDYYWYQFYKRTYYMSRGQRDMYIDKFCDALYDPSKDHSVKTLSMNVMCKNDYAKNKITQFMENSYELMINFIITIFSMKLTYDLTNNYYLYRNYDWAKYKTSETVPYQFKNIASFTRLEKAMRKFQLFMRNIEYSNFDSNNVAPVLKDKLLNCEIYFFEAKDKEIAKNSSKFFSADDIMSLMESILYLHDVGDKIQYYNMFYLERFERSITRSKYLYDHEVQCMFAHMHNYFLKDVYKKYEPEYINTEYILHKFGLDFKQRMLVSETMKKNEGLNGILTTMFVSQHQKFISKNLIVLLTDFFVLFYDKTGFVKESIYIENFLDTQWRLFYVFYQIKYSYIRIVSFGNFYIRIETYLNQGHILHFINQYSKYVLVALELSIFVMKYGYFDQVFSMLMATYIGLFVGLMLVTSVYFVNVPILLSVVGLLINFQDTDDSKDITLERFSIDDKKAQKYTHIYKAVWDTNSA